TTLTEYLIDVYGLGDATQGLCSHVLTLEIALHQAMCRLTDGNRIRCSQSLYPSSNVWRFSQCQLLLTPCSAHLPHNDQPRMDTDTDGELDTLRLLQTAIEVSQGSQHP